MSGVFLQSDLQDLRDLPGTIRSQSLLSDRQDERPPGEGGVVRDANTAETEAFL